MTVGSADGAAPQVEAVAHASSASVMSKPRSPAGGAVDGVRGAVEGPDGAGPGGVVTVVDVVGTVT